MGGDGARVLELEVLAHERLGLGVELRPLLVGEVEVGEVGVGRELDPRLREIGEAGVEGALVGGAVEQELERPVHEGALRGPRGRGLGEPVEVGELERERALLERRAGARRQRSGGCEAQGSKVPRGCDREADASGDLPTKLGSVRA